MRGILLLIALACAWAWLTEPGRTWGERPDAAPDVAGGPPGLLPGWVRFGSDPPPAPPANPLVLCRLSEEEQAYLRQSECLRRGAPIEEPIWARLRPPTG